MLYLLVNFIPRTDKKCNSQHRAPNNSSVKCVLGCSSRNFKRVLVQVDNGFGGGFVSRPQRMGGRIPLKIQSKALSNFVSNRWRKPWSLEALEQPEKTQLLLLCTFTAAKICLCAIQELNISSNLIYDFNMFID